MYYNNKSRKLLTALLKSEHSSGIVLTSMFLSLCELMYSQNHKNCAVIFTNSCANVCRKSKQNLRKYNSPIEITSFIFPKVANL